MRVKLGVCDRERGRRVLVSSGPRPEGFHGEAICFSLRVDNCRHIELAFGKAAADAVYDDVCALVVELFGGGFFGGGFFVGGAVYACADAGLDVVAWQAPEANGMPFDVLDTLCEGLALTSFVWKGEALRVALSVARAPDGMRAGGDDGDFERLDAARDRLADIVPGGEAAQSSPSWSRQYRRDMLIASDLLTRLDGEEFRLAWQPIVSVSDPGSVLYYEALARTVDRESRMHVREEAILALEGLGLVRAFDHRVVSMALDELQRHPTVRLGVNISARSAILDIWWERICARLDAHPALGRRLVIEITETAALPAMPEVAAFMAEMRRLGCRIALDDFGTGHASFRHLLGLSPDIVKIASLYLHAGERLDQGKAILAHLGGLAQALAPVVVIEGVENEAQSRMAEEVGLVWQQGYLLGGPSFARPWMTAQSNLAAGTLPQGNQTPPDQSQSSGSAS